MRTTLPADETPPLRPMARPPLANFMPLPPPSRPCAPAGAAALRC
jgi:hypothetical protein